MNHQLIDAVSLELGRRTANRLRQQPELVQFAHENLARWSRQNVEASALLRCYAEWRELLNRPLEAICLILTSETEEGQRLRQNSPFVGVLSTREVWEVKQQFRHATTAA